jgi:hypothetical protein
LNPNESPEGTNLLANNDGTKAVDESDSANLELIDFFRRKVISNTGDYN